MWIIIILALGGSSSLMCISFILNAIKILIIDRLVINPTAVIML